MAPQRKFLTRESLVRALRLHAKNFQQYGKLRVRTQRKLHIPIAFANLGHARKIELLTKSGVAPFRLGRFISDNAHSGLTRQVRGSIAVVSTAYRRYAAF